MAIVKTKTNQRKKLQSQFCHWEAHTQFQVCLTFFPSVSVFSTNTILKSVKHSEAMSYFLIQKFFSVCPSQGSGFTCGGVWTTEELLRPLWLAAWRCACTPCCWWCQFQMQTSLNLLRCLRTQPQGKLYAPSASAMHRKEKKKEYPIGWRVFILHVWRTTWYSL